MTTNDQSVLAQSKASSNPHSLLLPLALRREEAAAALGFGTRKLWALTAPRGPIPAFKVGTCVLYPVDGLREWVAAQAANGGCQ